MSILEIKKLFQSIDLLDVEKIIRTAIDIFGTENITFASSLGLEDQVLTHIIKNSKIDIEIFTLDTGRLFYEVYDTLVKTEVRYNFRYRIYFPDYQKVEKMVHEKGINLFYESIENRKLCCEVRKVEPLKRALTGKKCWITGLTRYQNITRKNLDLIEWDELNNLYKLNPLVDWTYEEINQFIKKNNIPYNILHDKGYLSIGCQPCTRAIFEGEDIRAGRWWWENPENRECGLHKK